MAEEKSTWDKIWEEVDIDSITVESNIAWQWVRNILLRIKTEGDVLQEKADDCEGFRKLATESTLRGAENRKKLEAVKALAPEILSWMETGVDWACSECRDGSEAEKMQAKHNETVRQFKELLGIEEDPD